MRCPTCGHDPDPAVTAKEALIGFTVSLFTIVGLIALGLWLIP